MREFFDQLISEGEAGIDRIISERTLETVQLDFKTKRTATNGRFEDDDKRVYGKALSAFANSGGGLLIWGVDARKGPDGVDCAQAPGIPITDIQQFQVEAIRFSGDLLMPRHDGIVIASIPSARASGSGYLLVQVERSERRPHRCEAKGDKHYYKRAGDSSFAMEHYDIEDAFRRFAVPNLKLGTRFSPAIQDGAGRIVKGRLEIYLENPSAVTAKMPYLQLCRVSGASESNHRPQNVTRHNEGDWFTYSGDQSLVVHPSLSRVMAAYEVEFDWTNGDCKIQGQHAYLWGFRAECRFGCENSAAATEVIELEQGDLIRAIRR